MPFTAQRNRIIVQEVPQVAAQPQSPAVAAAPFIPPAALPQPVPQAQQDPRRDLVAAAPGNAAEEQAFRLLSTLSLREKTELMASPSPLRGVCLSKNFVPVVERMSPEKLERIRTHYFDYRTKQVRPWDTPLTPEELECWEYQNSWLVCPITGRRWHDPKALLGIGLYHAPRFLSVAETQRRRDEEDQAAVQKRMRRLLLGREASVDGDDWAQVYEVYPTVTRPPRQILTQTGVLPDDVPMGLIQIISGPVFDKDAYNDGILGNRQKEIKSQEERGVLDMDCQWNALNFQYYSERAANSYERKYCTSRLSVFIDGTHGQRVFPRNIESQLSLLVYRSSDRLHPGGVTDQLMLARCIKLAIPRILQGVILEVAHGRESALDTKIDQSIRTWLLLHQISIKLIINYPQTYDWLYRSIRRWIQNPLEPHNAAEWPDVEHVLILSNLVGIPWTVMREAVLRRIFATFLQQTRATGPIKQRLQHWWRQNTFTLQCVLYEFCFLCTGDRPLMALDHMYTRCAGSLPERERTRLKQRVLAVQEINSLDKMWLHLGMETLDCDESEALAHIDAFVRHTEQNIARWACTPVPPESYTPPKLEEGQGHAPPTATWDSDRNLQRERLEALERLKHEGFPQLNRLNKLDRTVCLYCNRKFSCRDHLFKHLNKYIDSSRMIRGYHTSHFKYAPYRDDYVSLTCGVCKEQFETKADLETHYGTRGVPGFTYRPKAGTPSGHRVTGAEAAAAQGPVAEPDPYSNLDMCMRCGTKRRGALNVPCGHVVSCLDCAAINPNCPLCTLRVADLIRLS
eukprot:TRINITY_DN5875_c0_g1_i1.p1 TRINITY_DN5875_c0_g1~~TRINITY_DN5875_c0_g1_i1.p1  ORF type:complete len:798 (-),score=131.19 TRINITY_DN5875_c0_g1_i1:17-2410(-)